MNIFTGLAISDEKGFLLGGRDLDTLLHEILCEIYEEKKALFPPSIESEEDICENYRCFRTFRRTSDTRAIEEKVDALDIDIVNRWDQASFKHNKKVAQPMKQHYAQFELLLKPFLRYTFQM